MSSIDRRKYLTQASLTQSFLDDAASSLENRLEMVVDIETPTGFIRASDRNKYVGEVFYEALLSFKEIRRTVGEWLAPTVQFSDLSLEIANPTGRFNDILPHGDNFSGMVGRSVTVRLGLAEIESTYTSIFNGTITEVEGLNRSVSSFTITARDEYEKLSVEFPDTTLDVSVFPNIEDSVNGTFLPVIYGDWTTDIGSDPARVPAYLLNGNDPAAQYDEDNPGNPLVNLQFRISENDLSLLDASNIYVLRDDKYFKISDLDIVNIVAGNKGFEIVQNTGNTKVVDDEGNITNFWYISQDIFLTRVIGKDLGAYTSNAVWIARDILMTYGSILGSGFDANWETYRDKNTPAQSAIANIKARFWDNEPKPAIEFALSLLEQVRLEAFVDRNLKLKINSLHFEDFETNPSFSVKNWDVIKETFQPKLAALNNFNRSKGLYDFAPLAEGTVRETSLFKNDASIAQVGRAISKQVTYPNLMKLLDVENQIKESLKIASSFLETVELTLTWRALLLDIGDFISINVAIGGTVFENVPCMIRDIGYSPAGVTIPVTVWSFAMCPFPGYEPNYSGTVGGYNAPITKDV